VQGALTFNKILVANRGEIAIRAFCAGFELGAPTVAAYTWEDLGKLGHGRNSAASDRGAVP